MSGHADTQLHMYIRACMHPHTQTHVMDVVVDVTMAQLWLTPMDTADCVISVGKLEPVMVRRVPPAVEPRFGVTAVVTGVTEGS